MTYQNGRGSVMPSENGRLVAMFEDADVPAPVKALDVYRECAMAVNLHGLTMEQIMPGRTNEGDREAIAQHVEDGVEAKILRMHTTAEGVVQYAVRDDRKVEVRNGKIDLPKDYANMELYHLNEEFIRLQQAVDHGEDVDQAMLDELETCTLALNERVADYVAVIKEAEAQRRAVQDEKNKLIAKERTHSNNIKRMKDHLHNIQSRSGVKRITDGVHSSTICDKPAYLHVTNEDEVDIALTVTTTRISKTAAQVMWKQTGQVPAGFEKREGETYLKIS